MPGLLGQVIVIRLYLKTDIRYDISFQGDIDEAKGIGRPANSGGIFDKAQGKTLRRRL